MFSFPNIQIEKPVEIQSIALVNAKDTRVTDLANKHPNFATYLDRFSTEFEVAISPSILLCDERSPQSYRTTEAVAAFRDAVAISVVSRAWAQHLRFGHPLKLRFSNWFAIYPWMTDVNFEHVIMRSSAVLAVHDVNLLHAQTSPGLYQESVAERDIDQTLLSELFTRWKRRFEAEKAIWEDVKLFRSLNMANVAALLPSHGDFTPYDIGRSVALWVSAFEILAHPGGESRSGLIPVYEMLQRAVWNLTACKEARHPAMDNRFPARSRILACAIYSRIYRARNDYLHGNPVSDVQLSAEPYGRFLPDYAALLYRMALAGFLDLRFKEAAPSYKDVKKVAEYEDREFTFNKYQRDVEAAIATINVYRKSVSS